MKQFSEEQIFNISITPGHIGMFGSRDADRFAKLAAAKQFSHEQCAKS